MQHADQSFNGKNLLVTSSFPAGGYFLLTAFKRSTDLRVASSHLMSRG